MSWHYQLMKHEDDIEGVWYGVHEIYPTMGEGVYTEEPVTVIGCSKDDVVWQLKAILNDLEKHGLLNYE